MSGTFKIHSSCYFEIHVTVNCARPSVLYRSWVCPNGNIVVNHQAFFPSLFTASPALVTTPLCFHDIFSSSFEREYTGFDFLVLACFNLFVFLHKNCSLRKRPVFEESSQRQHDISNRPQDVADDVPKSKCDIMHLYCAQIKVSLLVTLI